MQSLTRRLCAHAPLAVLSQGWLSCWGAQAASFLFFATGRLSICNYLSAIGYLRASCGIAGVQTSENILAVRPI